MRSQGRAVGSPSDTPSFETRSKYLDGLGEGLGAGEPLCLIGDSGTGKSHLLIGLGTAATQQGSPVHYTLATKLVNELVEAADERRLTKTIARYGRVDLLCIDDARLQGTRPLRRRTALPGPHRTRGDQLHHHRL
ncbi:ATP-binding protein [Umezawaea sp. Da 62-37]|uniref:ATP-binding protein n=1 Tax=Umezawaea sp. Da 62-37 TaxID=3075927 RepID=UPI0028F6F9F5|nr:ATP-binding protein [Umezawaea sp. Da 62-37]WNV83880.1 ATP-binding protein [Umezawaea sp. Da 62-37]